MGKITKIIFMDNVKSRVVVFYFVLLALLSWTSLLLQDNESKGALTILNIILFVTPLMSLLYTVTYLYDAHDFLVLLLSQPVERRRIWQSLYTGRASPCCSIRTGEQDWCCCSWDVSPRRYSSPWLS